jgi:hypothetical protein
VAASRHAFARFSSRIPIKTNSIPF